MSPTLLQSQKYKIRNKLPNKSNRVNALDHGTRAKDTFYRRELFSGLRLAGLTKKVASFTKTNDFNFEKVYSKVHRTQPTTEKFISLN